MKGNDLTAEQRLILSVILLALSETDIRFVTWIKYGSTPQETQRIKERTVIRAQQFVASEEFEDICNYLNISADRMRKIDPEKAHFKLLSLTDPRKEHNLD